MNDEVDLNPYAPPKAAMTEAAPRRRSKAKRADLRAALEALEEHLADPANVAADLQAAGPRIRALTWGFGAVGALALGFLALTFTDNEFDVNMIAGFTGGIGALIAIISLVFDVLLAPRDRAGSPEETAKSIYRAIRFARFGYVWAALSPTARDQSVKAPEIPPVDVKEGVYPMRESGTSKPWEGIKHYTGAFARPGGGSVRTMTVKNVALVEEDGDVARVELQLDFQSYPMWVNIVVGISFALFRPAAIVGLILIFALRKRYSCTAQKTLLRGSNGCWYLFDADLVGNV
jgi:hypothetical protein